VMQRPRGRHELERRTVERQRGRVPLDGLDVRRRTLATFGEELRNEVQADDFTHEWRQRDRERPGAGADVEHLLLARQREQLADSLARLGSAPILLLGDEGGRPGEPPLYFSGFVPAIQMMTRVNCPSGLMSKKLQLCMSFFVPSTSSPM